MSTDLAEIDDWVESADSPEPAAPVSAPVVPPVTAEPGPSDRPADSDDDGPEEAAKPEDGMERDRTGRFRRRAKSQQATPADVPRIQELTKRLRQTEERLAAFESKKTEEPTPRPTVPYVPPAPALEFKETEPQLEQFADKDDPYGAWQRALAAYDRKRERFEEQNAHMQATTQYHQRQAVDQWNTAVTSHKQRLVAAVAANPAHMQALSSIKTVPPPALDAAIVLDNQGVDVALFLASRPELYDELVIQTAALPVTDQTVGTIQRLLRQRMTAVSSGAVTSSQPFAPAPRPPTPLRTAPMRTGESIPGDDDSLENHEAYFHRNGRPGRRR